MSRDKRPSSNKRNFRWQATLAVAFATLMLLSALAMLPGKLPEIAKAGNESLGAAQVAGAGQFLGDFDARTGSVEPNATQLAIVSNLGANASWNQFGTPSSLIKYGDYLATGLSGPDAATVARNWVDANKALFRLSSLDGLKLANDSRLTQSDGHAVLFRQEFGGLEAAQEGTITVGITGTPGSGWKIASVSASTTGDTALAGAKSLSPQEAWIKAAADIGRPVSASAIRSAKTDGEWTTFGVEGFGDVQRARERALLTPTDGVVPVFETIVLEGLAPMAFKHYVDARSGQVLVRQNLVMQSHEPVVQAFTGNVPNVDGGCGPMHGPYTPEPNGDTVSFTVVASGNVAALDIVLKLFRNGTLIQAADTATSPEFIVYQPSGGVPAGNYFVQVCEFNDGAAPGALITGYSGTITRNDVAGGAVPYPPKWKVFPANPLLGTLNVFPWNIPSNDIRKKWCWDSIINGNPVPGCDEEVGNLASRPPWDADPLTGFNTPTFTTRGNNAEAREAWFSPDTVQLGVLTPGAFLFQPVDPNRDYDFEWSNDWFNSGCDKAQVAQVGIGNDISAAVVNLFGMHNRMHDWSYHLGFTEENWNAQDVNFGLTSVDRQNDRVIGDVQVGGQTGGAPTYGGRDNANMISLPDGVHSITNMYLWQPLAGAFYAPCVDGDYDMAVIGHEYGHMIENRMIGKGGNRTGHHAGAMGESNGDLNGMEILNEYGYVPVSGENPFAVGAYVTGNKGRAIRNYGMNYPRTGAFPEPNNSTTESGTNGTKVDPLNFSNMGYDLTGGQVHADGEIWSATNFDIRQALITKYNAQYPASNAALQRKCAEGRDTPDHCPGNRRWIQIVYDAYLLMPVDPTMLQARDFYLAADMMRFSGANQNELWLAFARRGFGQFASSTNQLVNSDTDPKPDFASPNHGEAIVTFRAVASNEGNVPVNARVYVGHYEARVSPIAVTGTAASGNSQPDTNNLDNRALFVPGTYEFVVQAPGYGHVRFRETFSAGQTRTIIINMPTNWASGTKGAVATGSAGTTQAAQLIDDTEATNWDDPAGGGAVDTTNPSVTVDLAGSSRTINRVQVSAMLLSQNRFTALRQFRIDTSTNGVTFTPWITSAANAFPGFNPRPVAPELILRSFSGPSRSATHVRIVVLNNQCTGNSAFQGDQDNDLTNNSDCRQGSSPNPVPIFGDLPDVLAERQTEVHIAELQVFSSAGGTNGGGNGGGGNGGGGDDDDFDDDGDRDDEDSDDDNDGHRDDEDSDDDNDGLRDNEDSDDDNDGIADLFDSESTREELVSSSVELPIGKTMQYAMEADSNTVGFAGAAANGQALLVEIYDPQGVLIGSSLGTGVASAPVVLPGNYSIRVRNISAAAVTSTVTRVRSSRWP